MQDKIAWKKINEYCSHCIFGCVCEKAEIENCTLDFYGIKDSFIEFKKELDEDLKRFLMDAT